VRRPEDRTVPRPVEGGTHPYQGEADAVARTRGPPATHATLARDLTALGVAPGSTVLVHSSLSALGWVVGGAEAVVLALESALGEDGTLVMPAYSLNAPEPSLWRNPPVPEAWWPTVRDDWPPFDPDLSPTVRIGSVPETFRHQRGTRRSCHPNDSFCARGPNARRLLEGHTLDNGLGEGSPLARLYELGASVLLLGVDHSVNSSMHLAEYRAIWPGKRPRPPGRARVVRDGGVTEAGFHDLDLNSDDFARIGEAIERETELVTRGPVGGGTGRLMPQREIVDFAVRWIERNRT
jgi:aminoglycoside 3-N-acetyltransferase